MPRRFAPFFALLTICCTATAFAAEPNHVLPVWPKDVPGEQPTDQPERVLPDRPSARPVMRITDVSRPTISVFLPPAEKQNGAAVVVCPGGAYNILAWDLEGTEVADWLNSIGVTAVVLKYRVPRRENQPHYQAPLQDAQRTMRLVRHHAKEWKIDPSRVGILGFSAGGNLTVMTALHWQESSYKQIDEIDSLSCRPDFMVPVYAAYLGDPEDDTRLGPLIRVTKDTPPAFLVVTQDDKMRGLHAALLFAELKQANVPAEVHVFSQGGHGYGLRPSELPVSTWPKLCADWLRTSGLLTPTAK